MLVEGAIDFSFLIKPACAAGKMHASKETPRSSRVTIEIAQVSPIANCIFRDIVVEVFTKMLTVECCGEYLRMFRSFIIIFLNV
jgi:hypothetical protein